MNAAQRFAELETRARELNDLDKSIFLLEWDEETYAPKRARAGRGRMAGTLQAIRHQRLSDPVFGALIEELRAAKLDGDRGALVSRLARRRDLAVRVPERLVKALAEARSQGMDAWSTARPASDWKLFAPHLERIVALSRERAAALATGGGDPYDALLDEYEPGMTSAKLVPLFARLREALVPMVQAIGEQRQPASPVFDQRFDAQAQWDLTMRIIGLLGFDLERGRQDKSAHPFSASCGDDDVRLTTRISEMHLLNALYSTIHETGHGLYEQGFDPAHAGTELANAPGMGIHESQSRLWENQIGRSRAFWQWFLPIAREYFPTQLAKASVDEVHRAVNRVAPGPIRVDADEMTYNLHILLRFELETALISGELAAADVPGAWNDRMEKYLGLRPENDRLGCLQDIHWPSAAIGYFPSYTIGNVYSAQLMAQYERENPKLWDDVAEGRFAPLLDWLRAKVHRRGQTVSADQIVLDATGSGLDPEPLLAYYRTKYGALYTL